LAHEGIHTLFTEVDLRRFARELSFGKCYCPPSSFFFSTKMLEWKVIFRAGSLLKRGRELDKNGQPSKKWSDKTMMKREQDQS
jgi:hypothetical protein